MQKIKRIQEIQPFLRSLFSSLLPSVKNSTSHWPTVIQKNIDITASRTAILKLVYLEIVQLPIPSQFTR